ncbi:hypothetical protein CLV30_12082 [Haloactinopolyspora alba]|uniref:Uncharacterized protein n=1 Tax=Haloactinopolyspora alba TaxID=648780 RepID=A0A2P8DM63_9ACTN|nr:hypothetical protein CLV30_12082 [Haloactinopolyspora alba]
MDVITIGIQYPDHPANKITRVVGVGFGRDLFSRRPDEHPNFELTCIHVGSSLPAYFRTPGLRDDLWGGTPP